MDCLSDRAHRRLNLATALWLGVAGAVAVAAALSSLRWPLIHDAPLMHYIAWSIADGAVPHRDLLDMNLPGTYLVHLVLVLLPGDLDLNWRLFDLALLGTTLVLVARLIGPKQRWSVAGACIALSLLYLSLGPLFGGERDMLVVPLELLGVLGFARYLENPQSKLYLPLLAGTAFGAACTIKPFAAVTFAGVLVFALFWLWKSGRRRSSMLAGPAVAVVGSALPVAGVLAWFYFAGALPSLFDAVFGYVVPLYATVFTDQVSIPEICHKWLLFKHPYSFIFFFTLVFAAHTLITGRLTARYGLVLIGFLGGLAHFALQQKGWSYHLLPMATFGLMLCFWDLHDALTMRNPFRWLVHAAAAAWLILPVALNVAKDMASGPPLQAEYQRVLTAVEYLRPRLEPGETVQIFDTTEGGANVLLRLGVRMPTRFLYDFQLLAHDPELPYIRNLRQQCMADLTEKPPAFLVVFRKGWPEGGYERLEKFPELRRWIDSHYVLRQEHEDYRILERSGRS